MRDFEKSSKKLKNVSASPSGRTRCALGWLLPSVCLGYRVSVRGTVQVPFFLIFPGGGLHLDKWAERNLVR